MQHGATSIGLKPLLLLCALVMGCAAGIPQNRMGVSAVEIIGVEHFDTEAILVCLAMHKRSRFSLNFGRDKQPECDKPPFDPNYIPLELWVWPWTEWPLFDQTMLERDLDRIERWFQARGYYDALVVDFELIKDEEDREVEIEISVDQGEPVMVEQIDIHGLVGLSKELSDSVTNASLLHVGERFDEALYDKSKESMRLVLGEASFAQAEVQGRVKVDTKQKKASVDYEISTGPTCQFDDIRVEGNDDLSASMIISAAGIESGSVYSESKLKEAREAIYELGAFASVELIVEPIKESDRVNVLIRVVPAREFRFAIGAGIEATMRQGSIYEGELEVDDRDQWDLHLLLKAEHRNFLGGMRRLRVEDRPRMIFSEKFPEIGDGWDPGNLLMMELRQPAFFEPRTMLTTAGEWDYGPDPYEGDYFRHDLDIWIGPGRYFFRHRLYLSSTIHFNLFFPTISDESAQSESREWLQDYYVTFIQHTARLDLRNDSRSPRSGSYYALRLQHAGYFLPSNWDYIRLTPEVRGYLPLPLRMVLAARVRLGVLIITGNTFDDRPELAELRDYGPIRYRLRGGGPNSVRGYDTNTLGDSSQENQEGECRVSGGLRKWEASLELRIPLTVDLGTVLFIDVGDVTGEKVFRLYYPHTTVGFGLRLNTIVGPLRFDIGLLPKDLQYFGDSEPTDACSKATIFGLDGTFHLTIGEAF